MSSSVSCPGNNKRSFTARIECRRTINVDGEGLLIGKPTVSQDGCDMKVTMQHESGCPSDNTDFNIFSLTDANYPWAANWLVLIITYVVNPILWIVLIFQSLSSTGAV